MCNGFCALCSFRHLLEVLECVPGGWREGLLILLLSLLHLDCDIYTLILTIIFSNYEKKVQIQGSLFLSSTLLLWNSCHFRSSSILGNTSVCVMHPLVRNPLRVSLLWSLNDMGGAPQRAVAVLATTVYLKNQLAKVYLKAPRGN